jgi:hypothetical protein
MRPPRLATRLLAHVVPGQRRDALIGDLVERFAQRRSALWFWRQTIAVVLGELWNEKLLIVSAWLVSGYGINAMYVWLRPLCTAVHRAWYPPLTAWLLAHDLYPVFLTAYRLGLNGLTSTLLWCGLLVMTVWATARVVPRRRSLLAAVFIVSQVSQCLPYIPVSFQNWLTYRAIDPSWFFAFARFIVFALVILPSCVMAGIRVGQQSHGTVDLVE